MEIKCVVFIITMFGYVAAEENELRCCPLSNYVLAEEKDECWDPKSNTTSPIKLDCNSTVNIYEFTVKDGNVLMDDIAVFEEVVVNSSTVCIGNTTVLKHGNITTVRPLALLCYDENVPGRLPDQIYIEDVVLGYCMTVSFLFLILTVIIYSSFSELRDLFGKSVINFCTALALGLKLISIMKFLSYSGQKFCAIRGFSAYFFLVAAFFWANSISIQVLMETRRPCLSDYTWRKFKWYMVYSWGMPALLTTCVAMVNYLPGDHQRPGIGHRFCWFSDLEQQWYYMYSVMTILILINIVIFIYILTMVWRQTFSSSHLKALKFKTFMTMRLFVVMGLPWIFEMICASMETHIVWSIISIFNSSQGILLFLILVVFRKKVVKCLQKEGWMCCCSGLVGKCLHVGDEAKDNIVLHTDVPLSDAHSTTHQ